MSESLVIVRNRDGVEVARFPASEVTFGVTNSDKPPLTSRAGSESAVRELLDALKIIANAIDPNTDPDKRGSDELLRIARRAIRHAEAGGPPTPDLAAQPDSNQKDQWRRHPTPFDAPTPDLAAQPDSNKKGQAHELAEHAYRHAMRADLADGPNSNKIRYTVEDDAGTHTVELSRPRIGVHDYASLVSCLRENYKLVFGSDAPLTDPQDMIQRMTAEIQGLRRLGSLDLKGGGVQGDGNDARSSATEDKSDA